MISVRVDDYPWTKVAERDKHSPSAFLAFNKIVYKHCGKYLLGVIPCSIDAGYVDCLYSVVDDVVIGMHGIKHDERFKNEFQPWQTDAEVLQLLSTTRNDLRETFGQEVTVYMPPHNVIDRRTVEALAPSGFRAYTGGPETSIDCRSSKTDLRYLHSEPPHEYGRSDEMITRGSVEYLEAACALGHDVILTLHWTWENNLGDGYKSLDSFLSRLKGCFTDFIV